MSRGLHFALGASLIVTPLAGCEPSSEQKAAEYESAATSIEGVESSPPVIPANIATSDDDKGRACRAAIAALNGQQPSIIRVTKVEDGIVYTTYARPSDGKVWKNRCRFDGASITWSAVDLDGPNSGPGRWRDTIHDERMSHSIDGDKVTIQTTYEDGSGDANTYTVE